jgi:hypothetical protein
MIKSKPDTGCELLRLPSGLLQWSRKIIAIVAGCLATAFLTSTNQANRAVDLVKTSGCACSADSEKAIAQ